MSDDNPTPPPSEGAVPPPPPPPPPSYGAPPPPPAYGTPPPAYGAPPAYGTPGQVGMPPALPYASWGQRFLAWLIDNGPVIVLTIILGAALGNGGRLLGDVVVIGWFVYNYGYMQGTTGYTLGKGVIGIKLISEETGQPIGFGMGIARGFVHILDTLACFVGWLWPLWDSKRQTFADKILTQVVITAPKA